MKTYLIAALTVALLAAPLAASAQMMPLFSGFPYVLNNVINPGNGYGYGYTGYIPSYSYGPAAAYYGSMGGMMGGYMPGYYMPASYNYAPQYYGGGCGYYCGSTWGNYGNWRY